VVHQRSSLQELFTVLKIVVGAVLGYATARFLRLVGVYCVLFYGAEGTSLDCRLLPSYILVVVVLGLLMASSTLILPPTTKSPC